MKKVVIFQWFSGVYLKFYKPDWMLNLTEFVSKTSGIICILYGFIQCMVFLLVNQPCFTGCLKLRLFLFMYKFHYLKMCIENDKLY